MGLPFLGTTGEFLKPVISRYKILMSGKRPKALV